MNSYHQKQKQLFLEIEERFKNGDSSISVVEPVKNYDNDPRMCITSLAFIPTSIQDKIYSQVINPLKELDSHQYYYKPHSLHLTFQNVRVINHPPQFDKETIKRAQIAFKNIVPYFKPMTFKIYGLLELPHNLGLCVYTPEPFQELLLQLREELKRQGAPDDKKYASSDVLAGNITICRYYQKPNEAFFEKVKELKEVDLGDFTISEFVLITGNAVLNPEKTSIIETYRFHE